MSKYNWIDESINIDFELPDKLAALIAKIENHDLNHELGYYVIETDFLDVYAKQWVGDGITKEQYEKLIFKYR